MGNFIQKVGDDQYIEFSTVIDAPVTNVLSRDEMVKHLGKPRRGQHWATEEEITERMERCDKNLTTYFLDGRFATYENALTNLVSQYNLNRHGADQLTPEKFWAEYGPEAREEDE